MAGEECLYRRSPHPRFFVCSKKYVESILSRLPTGRLHLSTRVRSVSLSEGKTILVTATGKREMFDYIIFACHADDALRILDAGSGATPEERDILSAFRWGENDVWLHSDENVGVYFFLLTLTNGGGPLSLPVNASLLPRVVQLELYHAKKF